MAGTHLHGSRSTGAKSDHDTPKKPEGNHCQSLPKNLRVLPPRSWLTRYQTVNMYMQVWRMQKHILLRVSVRASVCNKSIAQREWKVSIFLKRLNFFGIFSWASLLSQISWCSGLSRRTVQRLGPSRLMAVIRIVSRHSTELLQRLSPFCVLTRIISVIAGLRFLLDMVWSSSHFPRKWGLHLPCHFTSVPLVFLCLSVQSFVRIRFSLHIIVHHIASTHDCFMLRSDCFRTSSEQCLSSAYISPSVLHHLLKCFP